MSDTPRTDAMLNGCEWGNRQDQEHTRLCRKLERELAAATAEAAALKDRIAAHEAKERLTATRLHAMTEERDNVTELLNSALEAMEDPRVRQLTAERDAARKAVETMQPLFHQACCLLDNMANKDTPQYQESLALFTAQMKEAAAIRAMAKWDAQ